MKKKNIALMLALKMLLNPAKGQAGPTIPGFYGTVQPPAIATLPVARGVAAGATIDRSGNQLTVTQNQGQENVTIDWDSFNVGAAAAVRFYQGTGTPGTSTWTPKSNYAALNRIYDRNPSLIYGSLKADGKVYLINQNGILFGPGSQVNVHSLAASALTIKPGDFVKGLLQFTSDPAENYLSPGNPFNPDGVIANHGSITTVSGGRVVLLGPRVENGGSITALDGEISLFSVLPSGSAGFDVDAKADAEPYTKGVRGGATVTYPGSVLSAESGRVRLFGDTVEHGGIIRSVTAVRQNGRIELRASTSVTTGQGSIISSPVSDSSETIVTTKDNPYKGGGVTISGLYYADSAKRIELAGEIGAPFGTVTLNAADRVWMETGSSIDVSGLWVDKPAGSNLLDVQMNSINLKDDYGQKGGVIKGETVAINPLYGSTIGSDLSGYLKSAERSARDQSTRGGTIDISVSSGDIIQKTGANLDFNGGGFKYGAGSAATTKLVSGNRVYDLSSAPGWITYGKVLGSQQTSYAKWGLKDEFKGLYLGGGSALNDRTSAYSQGSDAGTLSLRASNIVLDGGLSGRATVGIHQTARTNDPDARALSILAGLETPLGGTLNIGDLLSVRDYRLGNVVLMDEVAPLPGALTADSPSTGTETVISTEKLGNAGLSSLAIYSNLSVTTEKGSRLTLDPGSTLKIRARRFEHNGDITIHDGTVDIALIDNLTSEHFGQVNLDKRINPDFVPLQERIYLARGSSMNVSGERVDNSSATGSSRVRSYNYLTGGTISLIDERELGTVVIAGAGATLDVSGGYGIDAKGKVTGGDAGTLEVRAPAVVLDADLRGYSLEGKSGGRAILQARQVNLEKGGGTQLSGSFTAFTDLSAELSGQMTIGDDRFDSTGFSRFDLRSYHDLVLPFGTRFSPSYEKLAMPVSAGGSPSAQSISNAGQNGVAVRETVTVTSDYVGASSFVVTAGDPLFTTTTFYDPANKSADDPTVNSKQVRIAEGAAIEMAPGGQVSLKAPNVAIAGTTSAPAGTIKVESTFGDVVVESTGSLMAQGYNRVNSNTLSGLPIGLQPVAAGTVSLTAKAGISLATGSRVDVSGSEAVTNLQPSASGVPSEVMVAGDAGTLSLAFGSGLELAGAIKADPALGTVKGGTLSIRKSGRFDLSASLIQQQLKNGFDALTIGSTDSLVFSEHMAVAAGRSLTLDAPAVIGMGASEISLSAPWVRLVNSTLLTTGQPASGTARLTLAGGWIDLEGGVNAAGFSDVYLSAQHDIRLTDRFYKDNNSWSGKLFTSGNLTLEAGVVYPTTQSNFTLSAGKKITISGTGSANGPVYSVGGNLTVDGGGGVEQNGVLEAPLGRITLNSSANRVYLSDGSITSTAAESSLYYGTLDENGFWTSTAHAVNASPVEVTTAPGKNVTITGKEVVIRDGAVVDISGGGNAFSFQFQKGIEGSTDPFSKSGRYVIMPDNSIQLPEAKAIYIAGGAGIGEGVYSCLPEQYAFLPGALVVTATSTTVASGQKTVSTEGYPVVGGYLTHLGTGITSPRLQGFSVRAASDVMKEGHFEVTQMVAGDAGTFKVTSDSVVLGGSISSAALSGYRGGALDLSGKQVIVQPETIALPESFAFSSGLPSGLSGTLRIAGQTVNGKGLAELRLGDPSVTESVTVTGGSQVDVPTINVKAKNRISLEAGAELTAHASDGTGSITVSSPNGTVTIPESTLVRAGDSLSIEAKYAELKGTIKTDNGTTSLIASSLTGDQMYLVGSADADRTAPGFYLTDSLWNDVGTGGSLVLTGRSGVMFRGDLDLPELRSLTVDTPRLAGQGQTGGLKVAAGSINLLNSGTKTGGSTLAPEGTALFSANSITLGGQSDATARGAMLLDGFRSITLASSGDLTLMGTGALRTGWADGVNGQELLMQGTRLVTAPYRDSSGAYQRGDFAINGVFGAVSLTSSNGTAGTTTSAGGRVAITGDRISVAGTIDIPAGTVDLQAVGKNGGDGISLGSTARILSQGVSAPVADDGGTTPFAGGTISLAAAHGPVLIGQDALLDVSAVQGGDSGAIRLSSPTGGVTLSGAVRGGASTGTGGSFSIDARTVDLATLKTKLADGGFTGRLDIRSRQGDLVLAANETLRGRDVTLTADTGAILLQGQSVINAYGDATDPNGGRIALNAGTQLILESGALISARGTRAGDTVGNGGSVALSSTDGADNTRAFDGSYAVQVQSGARIDVSPGGTGATGGTVAFRAFQGINSSLTSTDLDDVNVSIASGTISGASRVTVEAVKSYNLAVDASNNASVGDASAYLSDAAAFIGRVSAATRSRLAGTALLAGIELNSVGDLTLDTPWDLTFERYGTEPGVLTLRAARNLTISANLDDKPTPLSDNAGTVLQRNNAQRSWGYNLVAGADLGSADMMAVQAGTGDLTMAGVRVYTEKAPIRFAAGNTMSIHDDGSQFIDDSPMISPLIPFNIGTYDGPITGRVNNGLALTGGVIQSAVGNIDITAGGDLVLASAATASSGAVRTTGEYTPTGAGVDDNGFPLGFLDYWHYRDGGSIRLHVGNNVTVPLNAADGTTGITPGWEMVTSSDASGLHWSASYDNYFNRTLTTQGVATMGGGDIAIGAGGDVQGQFGTFGTGDLRIAAGGDLSGRFLVRDGAATMTTGGNLARLEGAGSLFELFRGTIAVAALGNATLGTVVNPTIVSGDFARTGSGQTNWNLDAGYMDSSISLSAVAGDLTILGGTDRYRNIFASQLTSLVSILPPTLHAYAGGSIRLLQQEISLAPSPTGSLRLVAGGDIDGGQLLSNGKFQRGAIYSSDLDPSQVYGFHPGFAVGSLFDVTNTRHALTPIHTGDNSPNILAAGGDIANLKLYLPKATNVRAGRDITDLFLQWQHVATTDYSSVVASRDIRFSSLASSDNIIELGGPGNLLFMAGNAIDLGTTKGIQLVGATVNTALPNEKSGLFIAAGTSPEVTVDRMTAFFPLLRDAGTEFSSLLAAGEADKAKGVVNRFRDEQVTPLFAGTSGTPGSGRISMISSQISTLGEGSDIFIVAGSDLNVGRSVIGGDNADTGIFTAAGGAVNVFTKGDINVNESKIMTFRGGDITVWSDEGSVNAGRGSKTAVSAKPPHLEPIPGTNPIEYKTVFSPPSVGSGIRAVTYDPDGPTSPEVAPPAGDIYLFAPKGVIDAGEAGIAGGKVTLGATQVVNAQNISFSAGSVGVPAGGGSSVSVGALSGAGGMTDSSRMIEQTGTGAAKNAVRTGTEVVDDFMARFLDIKVINFDLDTQPDSKLESGDEKQDEEKNRHKNK